ncbi:nucleotidyltransferase family protein [Gordonia sp. LSe1-13]|uniref:Nucleotidyltransferase family protein n=1 Tax=Gordonia sesuvii TaxID=3116777 RepID=A0ABU7MDL5_9ACTN|nr:nucleotidyltransferase family protein [Gordonia sp. LSe1-13]
MTAPVCAVVLAAGGSRRLGRPKQLLPYAGTTLLGATLDTVRNQGFDQIIVTLGAFADGIVEQVDLRGVTVVRNDVHRSGCSSSIRRAVGVLDPAADGAVLLLGDQPGISRTAVRALLAAAPGTRLGAVRYRDGLGHPFWLGRSIFPDIEQLHGDKGVWKLIDAAGPALVTVDIDEDTPLDVDTEEDYRRLVERSAEVRLR